MKDLCILATLVHDHGTFHWLEENHPENHSQPVVRLYLASWPGDFEVQAKERCFVSLWYAPTLPEMYNVLVDQRDDEIKKLIFELTHVQNVRPVLKQAFSTSAPVRKALLVIVERISIFLDFSSLDGGQFFMEILSLSASIRFTS